MQKTAEELREGTQLQPAVLFSSSCSEDRKQALRAFVVSYLALRHEDALRREYPLCAVFNALRYVSKTGCG